jgi:hypothetical protein
MQSPPFREIAAADVSKYTVCYFVDNPIALGFFTVRYAHNKKHSNNCCIIEHILMYNAVCKSQHADTINTNANSIMLMNACVQKFCEKCHTAENINFYIEVANYRKLFHGQDHLWQHRDKIFSSAKYDAIEVWPSQRLTKDTVDLRMQRIHDRFLSITAPEQICIAGGVKYRTIKKMALPSLYGPIVFDEALSEPVRSMENYVIPMFLRSQLFTELKEYEALLSKPPWQLPPLELNHSQLPSINLRTTTDSVITVLRLNWSDIYRNAELYHEFSDFMNKRACGDSLSCHQLIESYQNCFDTDTEEAVLERKRLYKLIFTYFIAKDSPHEISCLRESVHTGILIGAATPKREAFDEARLSVMEIIFNKFAEFRDLQYPALDKETHAYQVSADCIKVVKKNKIIQQEKQKDKNDTKLLRETGNHVTALGVAAEAAAEAAAVSTFIVPENKYISFFSSWFRSSPEKNYKKKYTNFEAHSRHHMVPGRPHAMIKKGSMVTIAVLRGAVKISPV